MQLVYVRMCVYELPQKYYHSDLGLVRSIMLAPYEVTCYWDRSPGRGGSDARIQFTPSNCQLWTFFPSLSSGPGYCIFLKSLHERGKSAGRDDSARSRRTPGGVRSNDPTVTII